jgi:hypothetical protein
MTMQINLLKVFKLNLSSNNIDELIGKLYLKRLNCLMTVPILQISKNLQSITPALQVQGW